ncbi:hypothetical protein ACFU7T_12010 [Streptomyces sp. NPDC057555]|uniref:hypothetical protein n=1 Tax=Streptomyces sp. NPDC057555 TaxID=3346166 RepID=UPI0036B4ECC7
MASDANNRITDSTVQGAVVQAHGIGQVHIAGPPGASAVDAEIWRQRYNAYLDFIQSWERLSAEMSRFWQWLYKPYYFKDLPDKEFDARYEEVDELLNACQNRLTRMRLLGLLAEEAEILCGRMEKALTMARQMQVHRQEDEYDHYSHTDDMGEILLFANYDFKDFCDAATLHLAGATCEAAREEIRHRYE